MVEKIKGYGKKALEKLKKIPKKIYIIVAAVLVALVIAIVVLLTNKPYTVLFTGLNSADLSSITSYLDGLGTTDYKIENGDTVLVPEGYEASLKAKLLMEGYPESGFSYDHDTYFSNISSLSTESERETAWQINLEEKMSAVVRCFDNVKNATVSISLAKDTGYVLDQSSVIDASASVLVEMKTNTRLTNDQAVAIRRYIANAVQGLSIDKVDISDTLGNRYSTTDNLGPDVDASTLKLQLEEEQANLIRSEVMQTLIPFYGADNVRVAVSCTVDVSQRTENSRDVYLPDYALDGSTSGEGIKGQQVYEYWVTRDENDDTVGGLVGSTTNSDIPVYVENEANPNGSEQELGGSGTTVYDNPYKETVAVYTAGYLTDCSISVSINAEPDEVDVQSIREHVARAAGVQGDLDPDTGREYLEDKISVVAMPFYEEPVISLPGGEELPQWVIFAAVAGIVVFLLLALVIVLLRKRSKKRKLAKEAAELEKQKELEEQLAAAAAVAATVENADAADGTEGKPTSGADVMTLQTERSMELRKDIRQFASDNPEIAAQMIRTWLKGGESDG